jgi:hypothetical protein
MENYLYLNMNKKYRLKKKFIEINYDGLSSINYSNFINSYQAPEQQQQLPQQQQLQQEQQSQQEHAKKLKQRHYSSHSFTKILHEQYRENFFPLKISISKLNRLQ